MSQVPVDLGPGLYPAWIIEFMEPRVTPTLLPRWGGGDLQWVAFCFAHTCLHKKIHRNHCPAFDELFDVTVTQLSVCHSWQGLSSCLVLRCLLRKPFADLEILNILWRARPARPLPQSVWANFGSGKLEHYRAAVVTSQRWRPSSFHVLFRLVFPLL